MAAFSIASLRELDSFAGLLAANLQKPPFAALFLRGCLGAGKTTLVSGLVRQLPNGQLCETGSPSFNLCNIYPSRPAAEHFDLYRCRFSTPEELLESLDNPEILTIVEWSDFLPENLRPQDWLDICIKLDKNTRLLEITSEGSAGNALLKALQAGKSHSGYYRTTGNL